MIKHIFRIFTVIAVTAMAFTGACGGGDDSAVETGIIIIGVTDKPDEDISSIVVTTGLIEGNVRTGETENNSDWQKILDSETSFDLIAVAGIEDILGETSIPAATYNQIRMHVKSVVVTLNGEEIEAKVPSGIIRLVRPIEIKAGETTVVTFDFNAEESVIVTGADNVIFKPTVKLLVRKGGEPFRAETQTRTGEQAEENKGSDDDTGTASMMYGDEEGFFLSISMPEQPEVIVADDTIRVAGKTSVDAAVSIGDEFVDVNLDGTFEKAVSLVDGINIIEVVASIAGGQQYNQVLTVIYSP